MGRYYFLLEDFFMKVWLQLMFSFVLVFGCSQALANKNVGTITRLTGDVKILTKPRLKPKGKGPWVKYDGRYFRERPARIGYKLKKSYVVKTYSDGKAMVVFHNGDHINVGPGTSYELEWDEAGKNKNGTVLKLLYGKVRGVVSPKGPRKKMRIQTATAVAGVRGTDFHIKSQGAKTEVHVLRGKVEVKPKHKLNAMPVQVEAGFSGQIVHHDKKQKLSEEKIAEETTTPIIKKITKEKLVEIQKVSTVKAKPIETESIAEAEAVSKELKALEDAAKKTVLEDIKTYNPEDYKKITESNQEIDIHEINTAVVSKLFKEAPVEEKEVKFTADDFEDLDSDIYEKYFR